MISNMRMGRVAGLILMLSMVLGGCATLDVTPRQQVDPAMKKKPVVVGVEAAGLRLQEALNDSRESAIAATSGTLFDKVIMLPPEARMKTPQDIRTEYGADYLMSLTINDINVDGKLNPIWFASIPLFFFKPYAPIVTFETVVTLDSTVRDTRTGAVVMQKQSSEVTTDHFSPKEPQDKVRKLIGRGINNSVVGLLEELNGKVGGGKSVD